MPQHIPAGARLVATETGRGKVSGRRTILELWEGQTSLGYHSDYRAVEVRWVKATTYTDAERRAVTIQRFSGIRYAEARRTFHTALERLDRTAEVGA